MLKVFISSNQTEFTKERQFIKKQFEEDFFLKSFFEVFIFPLLFIFSYIILLLLRPIGMGLI